MEFKGKAKRIEDIDIPRIAKKIGVGEDELHAVMDVEAAGGGFDSKGRPKMLFEPHVFYRNLPPSQKQQAVDAGVAYPNWQRGKYPKDSYPRLIRAMAINESAALKSASWGMGQILGENYKAAGFESINAMVEAFKADEETHLEAMVNFIIEKKLDDDIRRHDWSAFARGYNGSQYAKHNYHGKLAAAYAKWSKIKDTPTTETPVPRARRNIGIAEQSGEVSVRRVQESLRTLGYPEVGFVDGKMGDRTRAAIAAFQINEGLKPTGELTNDLFTQIMKAKPRKISQTRRDLQVKDISDSSGVKIGNFLKIIGAVGGIFGAGGGVLDAVTEDSGRIGETVDTTIATVQRVNGFINTVFDIGPWVGIVLLGLATAYGGWLFIQHLLQGSREGRHV